jgi:alpha-N-acetylglucosamine transferase
MESDERKHWRSELEHFIAHWEQETEQIKEKILNPEECSKISKCFHNDSNGLLVRKPVDIADTSYFNRLNELDSKLNSALAMVCTMKKDDRL